MVNLPTVEFVKKDGVTVVCIMTSATKYHDGFNGVNYQNYDVDTEKIVGCGYSKGWDQQGGGPMLSATVNAKRAATRYIKRTAATRPAPLITSWIKWDGDLTKVPPPDALVYYQVRDGDTCDERDDPTPAEALDWSHTPMKHDWEIVAYKIVNP